MGTQKATLYCKVQRSAPPSPPHNSPPPPPLPTRTIVPTPTQGVAQERTDDGEVVSGGRRQLDCGERTERTLQRYPKQQLVCRGPPRATNNATCATRGYRCCGRSKGLWRHRCWRWSLWRFSVFEAPEPAANQQTVPGPGSMSAWPGRRD